MVFYTRSAAKDGGVPNFSGFLLRLSCLAALSSLLKVRAFQISHNVLGLRRFLCANKELHSNSSAQKMCRSFCVGASAKRDRPSKNVGQAA
jgi:hypothetical protein